MTGLKEIVGTIFKSDVESVCSAMGLPADAFLGEDGLDPRFKVICSLDTLDVEACPGSGKTTLLVAKLAILANRWQPRQQGVCVISHTNAARLEIGERLSVGTAAQRLLRYPHFVGTIHSFVNEFLAVPWLRSKGMAIKVIDTELAEKDRWRRLPFGTRSYLENQNEATPLTYTKCDFSGNRHPSHTKTSQLIQKVCKESTEAGYYCFDEMFVWANELLEKCPEVKEAIRQRFPVLFVDEVQDNSELQSDFIHRLFCADENPVVCQRFGDSNQAIYSGSSATSSSGDFPSINRIDLPNSFRFAQSIADCAAPLGLVPQSLIGRGPTLGKVNHPSCQNAIFLFDDDTVLRVLPEYAEYLIKVFSADALKNGEFTAVAGVHRSDKDDHLPRFMGHYAPLYVSQLVGQPKPTSLSMYVTCARMELIKSQSTYSVSNRLAEGVLHFLSLGGVVIPYPLRKTPYRYVLEQLAEKELARQQYLDLVELLILRKCNLVEDEWLVFSNKFQMIGEAIAEKEVLGGTEFLAWPDLEVVIDEPLHVSQPQANKFQYPEVDPLVSIRLGSIHSVKGETHTATLVLDSFHRTHHLKSLIPWLTRKKPKGASSNVGENASLIERLKLHYVAMTRPSHLLCLAMRKDSLKIREVETLRKLGWAIIYCVNPEVPNCISEST